MVRIIFRLIMPAALLAGVSGVLPAAGANHDSSRHAGGSARRAGGSGRRDADFVGGPQPLPAVPRGARFHPACRERARPQHPGLRAGAGSPERRPRLGPQHGQPALHRSARPRQRALQPRQRQGELSDADGASGHGPADRTGAGRRDLRLVARRWRRRAAIHLRLRRAGQFPRPLRPHHRRHGGCVVRSRRAAARQYGDRGARHLHRRTRRQYRVGRRQPGPAGRPVGRGILFPLLSRQRQRAILSSEPRRLQGRPGLRSARTSCRYGSARARCG